MEKEKAIKWLNELSELQKRRSELEFLNEDDWSVMICGIVEKSVHINGALKLCKLLDINYIAAEWECEGDTATEVAFYWNDVKFYALENYRRIKND